jgi:hypothetical protein
MRLAITLPLLFLLGVARMTLGQAVGSARSGVAIRAQPIDYQSLRPQLVTVSSRRQVHILIGIASGLVVGATVEAIVLNDEAKRCHGGSCEIQAADGLAIGMMGLGGAVIGGIVGALWPVRP